MVGTTHVSALLEADGTVAFVGPSVWMVLGWRPEDLIGRNFSAYIHPDDLEVAANAFAAEAARPGTAGSLDADADIAAEYRLRHADGSWVPFELLRNNLLGEPDIRAVLVTGRPVRARYALDQALGELAYDPDSITALAKLVDYLGLRLPGTCSAVLVASNPPEWVGAADSGPLVAGRGPWVAALASGAPTYNRIGEPGVFDQSVERAALAAGYRACWCEPLPIRRPRTYASAMGGLPLTPAALDPVGVDGGRGTGREVSGCLVVWSNRDSEPPVGYLGVIERVGGLADLAIKKRSDRQRMRQLVDFDQLTGALSRAGLRSMTAGSEKVPRTCVLFDLDDFKAVNDRYGHSVGDEVLRAAVKRVSAVMRYQDLLCRLGGDEFVILVAGGADGHGAAVARRVLEVLTPPIRVGSVEAQLGASVGVAPYDPAVPLATLIDRADKAMFAAKRHGKNAWELWTPAPV